VAEPEQILADFHARRPGASGAVFARARDEHGASSYERLAEVLDAPGRHVLDLGCGDGPLLELLLARGHTALGVDRSPQELAAARSRVADRVRLILGDAHALPLPDDSVDFVLCHMAFMLMSGPDRVAAEARRVLRPGGAFAAVVGTHAVVDPSAQAILTSIGARLSAERLQLRMGDPRSLDVCGWQSLFPRWRVSSRDFVVRVDVELDALWPFLLTLYYGLDYLSEGARDDFLAEIERAKDNRHPDGRLSFPIPMRLLVAAPTPAVRERS
jgi:SAM-dependent methyltransferase